MILIAAAIGLVFGLIVVLTPAEYAQVVDVTLTGVLLFGAGFLFSRRFDVRLESKKEILLKSILPRITTVLSSKDIPST